MRCTACGTDNEPGRKFCGECGAKLLSVCPSCGSQNTPGVKFCGECGTALEDAARPSEPEAAETPALRPQPEAERRLVSVLFADLVGFTALSETRDSEEVRELLTRYFDTCRTLIGRYGGVVEKFIGDAVMAVWGTPVATEHDPERAVRAALDLTSAVQSLGEEAGDPDLRARAGVLTGEAAVTIGAEGQGMVAGDLVNTASRIQSAAKPGSVLVGESTKRSTENSIVFEDAGTHELKGKAEPVPLWRATRVVSGALGAMKSEGLEAPFVGRDRELRLIKDLFHSSAEEESAHLVSVLGVAGLGKSRVLWEFFKYTDGLADVVYWHRGRCLAYGEGVTYWALAEMVKSRAQILEDEDPASAASKLHAAIIEHIPDLEERKWVEPRLGHLLGFEERAAREREELFSAWRVFFERLGDERPTVLVFEDLHWADPSLVDFIEYLLDWSRNHAIFVLTLARPELIDRFPSWGAGKRNFTSISLEFLPAEDMDRLLSGLVPGLPEELRSRILERAEGVPLYAVETVRMLLDRGLLVREGSVYRPTGTIDTLEVPESLHGLIAARLDGLSTEERLLLQDASVLGRTFAKEALAAIAGRPEADVEAILSGLVRKEVLGVQADPRSPERGQYGFLQDLVKFVAYETLSKRERKVKHLAVARFLESTSEEEEVVEVVASHYLQAYQAAPDADDAEEIKARARGRLVQAGRHAQSLAASQEAQVYFERASELTADPLDRAGLLEQAGEMALTAASLGDARLLLERAFELFAADGQTHAAARVSAKLAEVDRADGKLEEAVDRMERAFEVLSSEEPDENLATLAAELGRQHFFKGELDIAEERLEVALDIAEKLRLPDVISQALNTKGFASIWRGHPEEAVALQRHALEVALEYDIPSAALRAYLNLAESLCRRDKYDDAVKEYLRGVELARKVGNRFWELSLMSEVPYVLDVTGRWDDALSYMAEIPGEQLPGTDIVGLLLGIPEIHVNRGDVDEAERLVAAFARYEHSADFQERAVHAAARSIVLRAREKYPDALAAAEEAFLGASERLGKDHFAVRVGFVEAAEAALAFGDLSSLNGILAYADGLQPGELTPFVAAHRSRFRARLAAIEQRAEDVEPGYKAAAGLFREIGVPFWLAVTRFEHREWLISQDRAPDAEPLFDEARDVFERLGARPWLERLEGVASGNVVVR